MTNNKENYLIGTGFGDEWQLVNSWLEVEGVTMEIEKKKQQWMVNNYLVIKREMWYSLKKKLCVN